MLRGHSRIKKVFPLTFAKGSQGQLKAGCPQEEEWQEAAGTGLIAWESLFYLQIKAESTKSEHTSTE